MELDTASRSRGKTKAKSLEDQAKERAPKLRALEGVFFAEAAHYAKAKAGRHQREPFRVRTHSGLGKRMVPYVRAGNCRSWFHADEVRQIKACGELGGHKSL